MNSKKIGNRTLILTAIILAVLTAINLIIFALPSSYTVLDVTANKNLSVSKTTKDLVKNIDKEVTVYHISEKGSVDYELEALLERYADMSSRLDLEEIDPTKDPTFTKKYTDSELSEHSLIVESELRHYVIDYYDLFYVVNEYFGQMSYYDFLVYTQGEYATYFASYFTSDNTALYFNGEAVITTAIEYVTAKDIPCAYFLNGHGEASLDKEIYLDSLKGADILYDTLDSAESIPDNCTCLIVNAPTSDLTSAEADAIIGYLDAGGSMVIATAPGADSFTQLMRVMEHYGVTAESGIIREGNASNYLSSKGDSALLPSMNEEHDIAAFIKEQSGLSSSELSALMPNSHGIKRLDRIPEGVTVTALAETSDKAYLSDGANALPDSEGSRMTAVVIDKLADRVGTSIIWYSSGEMFSKDVTEQREVNSTFLFLSMSYVGGTAQFSSEAASTISAIRQETGAFGMTANTAVALGVIVAVIIPTAVLIIGLSVRGSRRRK